jgi:hypothetical protein
MSTADYNLLVHYDRRVPRDKIGRRKTMAYYDETIRNKIHCERKSKYYTPSSKIKQWHVVAVDVRFNDDEALQIVFPVEVDRTRLLTTLQFLCENTVKIDNVGLPSLLEMTSADRMQQLEDGRQCLRLSRQEYAIFTAALLPLYAEPSRKNIKRENGYKTVAWHPILIRYALGNCTSPVVDSWRRWTVIRTLAAFTNATVSGAPMLDYEGYIHPINSRYFVVYTLLPRVLDTIFKYFDRCTTRFNKILSTTTIIYDIMAAFLMPARLQYINYRLIDEVFNIVSIDIDFARRNAVLVTELRKLAAWVSTMDEHSRARIKVDRADARCDVNFAMLHSTIYFAACEPQISPLVAMAMLSSLAVSKRSNKSIFVFLDNIPTPCQFNRRTQDLFNRVTQGWPTSDHSRIVRGLMRDVATTTHYDSILGMTGKPMKLKKPHFPVRKMKEEYATRTFGSYAELIRHEQQPLMEDTQATRSPLEAIYLFLSSFDRHLAVPLVEEMDTWDLITSNLLTSDHLLPLSNQGHYLERSFFHL